MLLNHILIFIASALIIIISGIIISWLGDVIASRSKLGGLWIGVVLIAFVTSLPEVATAASAGRMGIPNLSAGDLFGSGLFNLALLAIADLVHYRQRLLEAVTLGHAVSGGLAIILTALASIFIITKTSIAIGGLALGSIFIFIIYFLGVWLISRNKKDIVAQELDKQSAEVEEKVAVRLRSLPSWGIFSIFGLGTLAILLAAPRLALSADFLADYTGLGTSFFGTLFVAFTTSLPELAVSIAAIRLAAFDLVVGNIFGSNAFNMGALIMLDLFYVKGSVYPVLSPVHAVTGMFIIIITTIAIMGLVFRSEKRYFFLEPDAGLILLGVIGAMYIVYLIG